MQPTITAYCFAWHITTSPAFRYLLSEPLAPFFNVDFIAPPDLVDNTNTPLPTTQPVIFCQRLPFSSWLADDRARIIWIPMWDMARNFPPAWWNTLPKTLRIVAFSDAVAERAHQAGLPTLQMRYAKDPSQFSAVDWQGERTLMYWNRTGLISPGALQRLCEAIDARRVLFRGNLDPYLPHAAGYQLPRRLGKANVQIMPDFMSHEDYLALLSQTHIFIAPRAQEGVGMTFLEAMASGSVVLAANAPTMNEYIQHEQTGILLSFDQEADERNRRLLTFKRRPLLKRWRQKFLGPSFQHPITETDVPVSTLEQCDPETLGQAARASLITLHQTWQSQLAAYAQFILEW